MLGNDSTSALQKVSTWHCPIPVNYGPMLNCGLLSYMPSWRWCSRINFSWTESVIRTLICGYYKSVSWWRQMLTLMLTSVSKGQFDIVLWLLVSLSCTEIKKWVFLELGDTALISFCQSTHNPTFKLLLEWSCRHQQLWEQFVCTYALDALFVCLLRLYETVCCWDWENSTSASSTSVKCAFTREKIHNKEIINAFIWRFATKDCFHHGLICQLFS